VLAGGAEEAAVAAVRRFEDGGPLLRPGVPVELHGVSSVLGRPWFCGAAGRAFPLPEAEVAAPAVEDLERPADVDQAFVVRCGAGWRCSGAEERRFPGRSGEPPSPSFVWRCGGGFRRRDVLRDEDVDRAQLDHFVIFLAFWASL
jgi:hypothetical protein